MIMKYSDIRGDLKIQVDKKTGSELAHLTHFLQNSKNGVSQYFRPTATEYVHKIYREAELNVEESLQLYLDIEWDIPFKPTVNPKFSFIDLFAGIGGMRLAFQELEGKCVFTSEWDTYAKKTYEANFGKVPFGDITKIDEKEIPNHDILVGGFPCQPFSLAGVSKKNSLGRAHGFMDKTQGTLFFDVARIIKHKKPKAFLLENVKNLRSHDGGNTLKVVEQTLLELGYYVTYKILDGKHYVPQHRERIIIVGFRKDQKIAFDNFTFPRAPKGTRVLKDILEPQVDPKYTLSDKLWQYLQNYAAKHKALGNGFGFGMAKLDGITRTLSARYYKDGSEILIAQKGKNPRRLTPKECARLQGFPDKFLIPVSNTQAYKQFGNSVVYPLIKAVGREIIRALEIE
jgi:DNA (cytosine-5)-methyltransferase 1